MERHPLSAAWPDLTGTEKAALADSIRESGLLFGFEIAVFKGQILDGWHRYQACLEVGEEPRFWHLDEDRDPVAFVLDANQHRRHLSPSQQAAIYATLEAKRGRPRKGQEAQSYGQAGERTVKQVRRVARNAPELVEAIQEGHLTARDAEAICLEPAEDRASAVDRLKQGQTTSARHAITQLRRERVAAGEIAPPQGLYHTLVVDLPWPLTREMKLPAHDDCILWLFSDHYHLKDAFDWIDRNGWQHSATLTWCRKGDCQNTLNSTFILLAKRGNIHFTETTNFYTWFEGEVMPQTDKPTFFYDLLRRVSPPPRHEWRSPVEMEGFDNGH